MKMGSKGNESAILSPNSSAPLKNHHETNIAGIKLLIQLAIRSCEGKSITNGALKKITEQAGPISNICEVYAGILGAIQSFLRQPMGSIKADTLKDNLKELKLPEQCIADLVNVLCGPHREVLDKVMATNCFYLKLENFRWRIDITISSSALLRVLEPTILFEMCLSNGNRKAYEVTIAKFHELRYSVATVLKEMETIEKKKLFNKKCITGTT